MRFAASAEGVNELLDFFLCRVGTQERTSDVAVQNLASLPKVTIVGSLSQKVEPCTEATDAQRRPCVCQLGCEGGRELHTRQLVAITFWTAAEDYSFASLLVP